MFSRERSSETVTGKYPLYSNCLLNVQGVYRVFWVLIYSPAVWWVQYLESSTQINVQLILNLCLKVNSSKYEYDSQQDVLGVRFQLLRFKFTINSKQLLPIGYYECIVYRKKKKIRKINKIKTFTTL